jgi:hypothetical protein
MHFDEVRPEDPRLAACEVPGPNPYVRKRTECSPAAGLGLHMLHELVASNRDELISRCKTKVAKRFAPEKAPPGVDHGVPLFLQQLVDTLRFEQGTMVREASGPVRAPSPSNIGRAAALHGADMLRRGYTLDQVVHDYGDVCQAVTDMAVEQDAVVSADEFRTLNRCLDNAIADAVTAFARDSQAMVNEHAEAMGDRLTVFSHDHARLLDLAIQSFAAIQTGSIGATGATGMAHRSNLIALRILVQQFMPQIRLASAKTTLAPGGRPPKA